MSCKRAGLPPAGAHVYSCTASSQLMGSPQLQPGWCWLACRTRLCARPGPLLLHEALGFRALRPVLKALKVLHHAFKVLLQSHSSQL